MAKKSDLPDLKWTDFLQEEKPPNEDDEVDLLDFFGQVAPSAVMKKSFSAPHFRPRLGSLSKVLPLRGGNWRGGNASAPADPPAAASSSSSSVLPKLQNDSLPRLVKGVKFLTTRARAIVDDDRSNDREALSASVSAKAFGVTTAAKRYAVAFGGVMAAEKLPSDVTKLALADVMAFGSMRTVFSDYLTTQLANENLEFWEEVQRLKLLTPGELERGKTMTERIFSRFISKTAEVEVNVSSGSKQKVSAAVDAIKTEAGSKNAWGEIFKPAERDVWMNLTEVFASFVKIDTGSVALADGLKKARESAASDYTQARTQLVRVAVDLAAYVKKPEMSAGVTEALAKCEGK